MLGDDLFKKCLHEFISRWNGKHPLPYDFFFSFNDAAGQNLNWYFKPWFFETKYPNLSLLAKQNSNGEINISVTNLGGLPLPIILEVTYDDDSKEIILNKKADEWKNGNSIFEKTIPLKKKIKKVELGSTQIPDVDLKNNSISF